MTTLIARATTPIGASTRGSPSMVGGKRPYLHRFHLMNGRVLEGRLHRIPNSRLTDFLATLKGYISLTECTCVQTGAAFPYVALNQANVLFIEELDAE